MSDFSWGALRVPNGCSTVEGLWSMRQAPRKFARGGMFAEPRCRSGRKTPGITGSVVGFTASIRDHGVEEHAEEEHSVERTGVERTGVERTGIERPRVVKHRYTQRRCHHEDEGHAAKASSTVRFLHRLHDHISGLDPDVIGRGITSRCRSFLRFAWHA